MKEWFKKAFKAVIEDMDADESVIEQYFAEDYRQYVDGHELDYQGFIKHMKAQKAALQSVSVEFKHLIAEDDKIASIHFIHAIKKDCGIVEGQVNAVY